MADIQPRRSSRQQRQVERFQPEGRRQQRRPIPYDQHARNRRLQQQQQQQQPQRQQQHQQHQQNPAIGPEEDPENDPQNLIPLSQIVSDFTKWSRTNKVGNKSKFISAIDTHLPFYLLALAMGSPTELSQIFTDDDDFLNQMHRLSTLHVSTFEVQPQRREVLQLFTSRRINPELNNFLYRFVTPQTDFLTLFFRNNFDVNYLTEPFLYLLALYCTRITSVLPEIYVTGHMEAIFSKAEICAVKSQFFCTRCKSMHETEPQFLSHIVSAHKAILHEDPTENDEQAMRARQHLQRERALAYGESLQNALANEDVHRNFISFRRARFTPVAPGFDAQDHLDLDEYGYRWRDQWHPNDPTQFRPNSP
jgi:hypothetical protein